ncbi:MAG: sugar ABC transporter ATP-binding protein, partial [Stackebrandtia sp.]
MVGDLSVAENLFLNRQPRGRFRLLSAARLRRQAQDSWAVPVDPTLPARVLDTFGADQVMFGS